MDVKQLKKRRMELLIKMEEDLSDEQMRRLGEEYQNIQKMIRRNRKPQKNTKMVTLAKKNGINPQTYYARVKTGMSEFEAATKPLQRNTTTELQKWIAIAEKNGISENSFRWRIYSKKMSYHEAATKSLETERSKWLKVAKKYGIKESTFDSRIYNGNMNYEDAALTPVLKQSNPNSPTRKLINIKKLCDESNGHIPVNEIMKIVDGGSNE